MVPNFLSVIWHGGTFHGLGVQGVKSLILVDAYLCLMEEEEEKERQKEKKEKYHHGEGGFLWGWTRFTGCAVGHSY
jgi:hypothetical protein